MDEVTIKIDRRWAQLARSPVASIATTFSGMSVSFAPLFLYFYGQGMAPIGPSWLGIPLCWLIILGCGFFHIKLTQHVMKQLKESQTIEGKT